MGKKRRYIIRAGTRSIEKDMIKRAEYLLKHPEALVPECHGKCLFCPFRGLASALHKVAAKSDDEKALIRYSKHGDPISMAFATLLLVRYRKNVPYMANVRIPNFGTIAVVMWGKASSKKLLGIQYFDNPVLRLLAYYDIAKKKKIYLYSMKDRIICTGKVPQMPHNFLDEALESHPVRFTKREKNTYSCIHAHNHRAIVIHVASINTRVMICHNCASRTEGKNTLHVIMERIAGPKPMIDFDIDIDYHLECNEKVNCTLRDLDITEWDTYNEYMEGDIDDKTLLARYHKDIFTKAVEDKGIYVIGQRCYERDRDAFIGALTNDKIIRNGLKKTLRIIEKGIYLDRPSVNRIFSMVWDKEAAKILGAVVRDKKAIKEVMTMEGLNPLEALKYVVVIEKQNRMLKGYPKIKHTSPVLALADKSFRFYKVNAIDTLDEFLDHFDDKGNLRAKALKYAIASTLGINVERHGWSCTPDEKKFGEFLKPYVKNMFEANERDYLQRLEALISVTASGDKVEIEG